MKNIILFTAVLSIICCMLTCSAQSEEPALRIEANDSCSSQDVPIRVTDSVGNPIAEASVTVICRNRMTFSGVTDSQGMAIYRGEGTKTGLNDITAKKEGYEDAAKSITVSLQCIPDTTTTVAITTSTTLETTTTSSTTTSTTTTTRVICNINGSCDQGMGETYLTCPQDCSGGKDDTCDKQQDGRCDPDCARGDDIDCSCVKNNVCEPLYENYDNCADCIQGKQDSYCDNASDGVCDPDCPAGTDPNCINIDFGSMLLPLIVILVVFGIGFALNLRREARKMNEEKGMEDTIETLKTRLRDGEDPEILKKELTSCGKDPGLLAEAEKRIWE